MKRAKAARAIALAMRVVCNEEGDDNGGKSDGDEGAGQSTATVVGNKEGNGNFGKRGGDGNKGG
jgi:hypothetical protein